MSRFLFDTNVIVAMVRNESVRRGIFTKYRFAQNEAAISVVVQGELESLVLQWQWGYKKRSQMEWLLSQFVILPIKTLPILTAYARIDAYSQGKLEGKPLPIGVSARNMGKNDQWIAATAHAATATLVTTDNDFDHLRSSFIGVDWVDIKSYF